MSLSEIVECRSDSAYAGRPRAFTWQGERLQVAAILDRWRSPSGVGFRLRADDEQVYDLEYNEELNEWSIQQR
jgi:hypothetical protein